LGIVFVVGVQTLFEFRLEYLIGNLILLCAMLTWGTYSIIGKVTMRNRSSLETTAGGIFFGTFLFFLGALSEQFWTLPAMGNVTFWVNVTYMGVFVTVLGFLFYFMGLKHLGASHAAVFISLVPVFGTLFSITLLSEPLFPTFLVGLILVVSGILIINYPQKTVKTANYKPSDS
jgi:drug/metabolite transporter (DMT)-like permease